MKIEMPDNRTAIIDDGTFVIATDEFGQYTLGTNDSLSILSSGGTVNITHEAPEPTHDPHRYMNGVNGLTVDQSTERAAYRVYHEIWNSFDSQTVGDVNLLRQAVRTMIVEGAGRQAVYSLAGGIKKGVQQGLYTGVPLAFVMKGFVDGYIQLHEQSTSTGLTMDQMLNNIFGTGR